MTDEETAAAVAESSSVIVKEGFVASGAASPLSKSSASSALPAVAAVAGLSADSLVRRAASGACYRTRR